MYHKIFFDVIKRNKKANKSLFTKKIIVIINQAKKKKQNMTETDQKPTTPIKTQPNTQNPSHS